MPVSQPSFGGNAPQGMHAWRRPVQAGQMTLMGCTVELWHADVIDTKDFDTIKAYWESG